jgi:hypothetical protein
VGDNEVVVRNDLPDPEAAVTDAVGGGAIPARATCVDYQASLITQLADKQDGDLHYRFCFADGILVAKSAFHEPTT